MNEELEETTEYDHETSAIVLSDPPEGLLIFGGREYPGASTRRVSEEAQKILDAPIDPETICILPTGELYWPQMRVRERLNAAFGSGGWFMIPRGDWKQDGNTFCREYALLVDGRIIAEAFGEQDYHASNARMSKATACEAVKSNAIVRCAKDLGIAKQCWDPIFSEQWRRESAVKVWRAKAKNSKGERTGSFQWGRKSAYPFYDEGKAETRRATNREKSEDTPHHAQPKEKPGSGETNTKMEEERVEVGIAMLGMNEDEREKLFSEYPTPILRIERLQDLWREKQKKKEGGNDRG